ncbi:MAG: hypothetical protein U1E21_21225 [Reyranellaceae bacterium]
MAPAPGVNVVIWTWSRTAPGQRVVALDPTGELPRNQDSWPPP